MFTDFELTAAHRIGKGPATLFRIPMSGELQRNLARAWYEMYTEVLERDPVGFDPAYTPDEHQVFRIAPYELPAWLLDHNIESVREIPIIPNEERTFRSVQCALALAWDRERDEQVMLFQNFTRSKVISPSWRSVVFFNNLYQQSERHGMQLANAISAVFFGDHGPGTLLFSKVRDVNTYLPMETYYREATTAEVREILSHRRLSVEDADAVVEIAGRPWYSRRFLMLKDSGILDAYEATLLRDVGARLDVQLELDGDAIRLPSGRTALRDVLTFLNEERFRGAITDHLYEAASRRELGS